MEEREFAAAAPLRPGAPPGGGHDGTPTTSERRSAALRIARDMPASVDYIIEMVLRDRSRLARYLLAIGVTLIAAAATALISPWLGRVMFVLFWPAVLFVALVCGLGPAALSSLLAVAIVNRLLLGQHGAPHADDVVPLTIFVLAAMTVSSLASALRSASRRQSEATTELHQLSLDLEEQATELEQQLEESQALQEEVEQTSAELAQRTLDAEAAEAFSSGILASISDPFVVHDADWRFVYINQQANAIFRRSMPAAHTELVGRVLWDVYPEIVGTQHETQMRRAAADRVPVTYEAYNTERGTWSVMSCYPLPDGGLATQWRDVTARRRSEETARYLARASEVLSASLDVDTTLSELAHVVVPELAEWCTVHLRGDEGELRVAALAHADPEKIRWARELSERYPPDPGARHGAPEVIRSGQPLILPEVTDELLSASARDDEHRRIVLTLGLRSAMIVPLVSHGRVLGALSLFSVRTGRRYGDADLELATELARRAALAVDNSMLHQAETRARIAADEANSVKLQFLAVMSHELRTPLNAIGGYADLMRLGLRGPVTDAQMQDLDRIVMSQRALLGIINDILNFAKIDAGHLEFRIADVPLAPLLGEVEGVIAPQVGAGSLTLDAIACDPALAVRGDREKIRQIFLNLLSNAVKFTLPGGHITIRCTRDGGMARIDVCDTGIGIAADRLEAVFDPFVQLDRTLTSQHEGTGLGLAISRDLARAMGGEIVASSTPRDGSVFTLTLPLAGSD